MQNTQSTRRAHKYPVSNMGKLFILIGLVFVAVGLLLVFVNKVPFLGRLPGDIYIKKENFTFYFPIATSILISLVLSFLFFIFSRRH